MNQLHVGFNKKVMPVGGCLFIGDDISEVPHKFRPRVFDPAKHSFNPIKNITEAQAQEFAEVIYTVYGQGENTLTVRNGQIDLAPAVYKGKRLDEVRGSEEVERLRDDILFNPVVRNCLSSKKKDFVFDAGRVVFARLNRKELGTKASLLIGLCLMSFYKGELISRLRLLRARGARVPDTGGAAGCRGEFPRRAIGQAAPERLAHQGQAGGRGDV
jgi:hypothetical protein